MLTILLFGIALMILIDTLMVIGKVGKHRPIITGGEAVAVTVVHLAVIVVLVLAALALI